MDTEQKSKPNKMNRTTVPIHTRLKLFGKSAGRCQFCNDPVWRNDLTLTEGNFGELAHIIAASEDGPRGGEDSANLQIEYANLMLLCKQCHKEIDDNPGKYSAELLREAKWKHETRIERQTRHPEDIRKSTVVLFTVNIGTRIVPINAEAYRNAMYPKFPVDERGIKFEKTDFNREGEAAYWNACAQDIERKIKSHFEDSIDAEPIKHLSVFALGPMPLLMFLGKCIGDTVPADLYQAHRDTAPNQRWSWPVAAQETETPYLVKRHRVHEESENVALVLSLSGKIPRARYERIAAENSSIAENVSIYEITVAAPSLFLLKSRKQLEGFRRKYRDLLNEIQATHGDLCKVFILPAVPAPIAVACGRVILPTSDPEMFVCEYDGQGGYKSVLKIN